MKKPVSEKELAKEAEKKAKQNIFLEFLYRDIARAENFLVSDEEVNGMMNMHKMYYPDQKKFDKEFAKNEKYINYLRSTIIKSKSSLHALEKLCEPKVTEISSLTELANFGKK